MSDQNINIQVTQESKKKSTWEKLKGLWSHTPPTTIEESDRFSKLGYMQYPKRQQLDMRLFQLKAILEEIEDQLAAEDVAATNFSHIRKLVNAFMIIGSPWFRGLNNRELAKKAVVFYKLESMIVGKLPAFYPDLKRCVQVLINMSWQALDVVAETPLLFETRTVVQPAKHQQLDINALDWDTIGNENRQRSQENAE